MRGSGLNHACGIARIASPIAASRFTPSRIRRSGVARVDADADPTAAMSLSVTHHSQPVQDAVTIVRATTSRLVDAFVELPYAMYARDPHWVPPLRRDEYRRLDTRRNPFFAHADIDLWVAFAGAEPCGRIAAIEDRAHNEYHRERLAWFGFFEAGDEPTARALLAAAEEWGRARRCTAVRGPANPSLNESAGLLVDGFDDDPCLLMPYNPPTYRAFIEGAGYRKAKDLLAWRMDLTLPVGK